ncbi:MAG: SDR family oxidoreductase [Deltaproteobacteria bacterium]|nr:SDR family oxidoreductase [Deltaproteobacteria bacterium]
MAGRLDGRVAIVTGAGFGIGRGIARRFAHEGAAVVVAEIDPRSGERTASEVNELGGQGLFVRTDVTERADVEAAVATTVERFGRLDVAVNNAWGGGTIKRLEHKSDDEMRHGVQLGYMAVFFVMQASFPHLKKTAGSIVTLCSLNGVNAHLYTAEYNGAKEAARALTRTAAREWARHGIRANVICPAAATEAYEAFRRVAPDNAAALLKQNPMGRMGDPENDIGSVALFLASDDSRYVTGNTLFVDGGSHLNGVQWDPELPEE